MRRSSAITVTILGSLLLTCCLNTGGCGRRSASAPDYNWYDKSGNRIEERWKTDDQGNKLLDDQGRTIPLPHVPYDRDHREWVYQNGAWVPLPPPGGRSSSRTGGFFFFGGSGYRSGSGSSVGSGGSSRSSISRGGFGTTGFGSS
ncbi:MAG: hypothetical protein L0241_20845 [Planctomycetia bacterium]|nr:hypothetical protein [Planctomycetia bacterium]